MATGPDSTAGICGTGLMSGGLPFMDPVVQKSLVEAYAARQQSEADYAR